jgi:hypothetical protein
MTPLQEAKAELRLVRPDLHFVCQKLAEALETGDRGPGARDQGKQGPSAETAENAGDGHHRQPADVEVRAPVPPPIHARKTRK